MSRQDTAENLGRKRTIDIVGRLLSAHAGDILRCRAPITFTRRISHMHFLEASEYEDRQPLRLSAHSLNQLNQFLVAGAASMAI
jgi:hypothetical protein